MWVDLGGGGEQDHALQRPHRPAQPPAPHLDQLCRVQEALSAEVGVSGSGSCLGGGIRHLVCFRDVWLVS